jgi:trehalose 6-phosphate synthase
VRRKLIVVSNRGPISFSRGVHGELTTTRGGGGLATALRGLLAVHDVTWIASAISDVDRELAGSAREETARDGSVFRLRLVAHDEQAYDWYYNVVSNPTLWFVHHHLWELAYTPTLDRGMQTAWADGYAAVNRSFADAVLDELEHQPDAAVCFHDYHLYLAPRYVRGANGAARQLHFVHVPWPESDSWRVLPSEMRLAVHEGLLANDLVVFQSERWRRNFVRSVADFVGGDTDVEERTVVAPISVDVAEFAELARSEPVLLAEREIVARRPEKLVVRVDRTDPSKNIVRGFRAFELLLDAHPELRGRVGMLALLDPSRQEIPEYAEYLGAIQREARRVNDRFQENGWTPIELHIEDDLVRSVAAYKQFDVLLVNAIFDGMNLVAKEAPLVNERDGVVVLSENTGAHAELGRWTLAVNPFDVEGQAAAMQEALELEPGERARRLDAIRSYVREHDVQRWIERQLTALDGVRSPTPS